MKRMTGIGASGIVLISVVALVIFGPKKLPELGRAVGKTLKEFKDGTRGIMDEAELEEAEKLKKSN
jgi:sec-independent protein translocase protein TatA